jgi:peptide/nickel transport system substrate-binding protein
MTLTCLFQALGVFVLLLMNVFREWRRRLVLPQKGLAAIMIAAAVMPSFAFAAHDTLTVGVTQFPPTLNPNIDPTAAKSYVLGMAVRPFTVYGADWRPTCLLCTTLPSIENGQAVTVDLPNGKKGVDLTYTIRPEAKWGDGVPVTTTDVLFTYKVGRNPLSAVGNAELYRRITSIDAKDDKTFTMHFDKLTFDYESIDDFVLLPAHLEEAAFADPAQYRLRTLYATNPTNPGLYDGPYRISEVATGSHIVLEPNQYWAGPPPHFGRIVVRSIENTAALEANLLSGAIDMVAGEAGMSLDDGLAFEQRHRDAFQIVYKPNLSFEHVDLNLDRRVRQALLFGLNREAMSQSLFAGRQPVADSFVSPLDFGYSAAQPHYAYDQAHARELLENAGWHADGGEIRHNAQGQKLSLELATTAGNRTRELVEQVLQSQWRAIGVDVRIKNQPARVLFGETVPHRRFDMALYAWISAPENVPRTIFYSNEVPTAANAFAGQNAADFKNTEMDRLIDAAEIELDAGKRKALWADMQRIYMTELPSLPLYFRSDVFILPKWLSGVRPTGNQSPSTLWIADWTAAP